MLAVELNKTLLGQLFNDTFIFKGDKAKPTRSLRLSVVHEEDAVLGNGAVLREKLSELVFVCTSSQAADKDLLGLGSSTTWAATAWAASSAGSAAAASHVAAGNGKFWVDGTSVKRVWAAVNHNLADCCILKDNKSKTTRSPGVWI